MSTPEAKRRRIDAASNTLSKPFRSPFKTPFKSPIRNQTSDSKQGSTLTPLRASVPILSEKTPNLPSTLGPTLNRVSPGKKTFSSPVASAALNTDPDVALILRKQRDLERQLRELKEELETADQARKIERDSFKKDPGGEIDGELVELMEKWRSTSRQAAEELFSKVRDRVNR